MESEDWIQSQRAGWEANRLPAPAIFAFGSRKETEHHQIIISFWLLSFFFVAPWPGGSPEPAF
jgi:hypothetical protein